MSNSERQSPAPTSSDAILARLLALHPKIIDLSLDRIEGLLQKLGSPHKNLPKVIHVAGTNGKGSVVATMLACLEAGGKKVHVYTSPHLVAFRERIRLAGAIIPEADLCALLDEVEKVNDGEDITFFEITTAAAFLAFSRMDADYLLLEVGLGGRLDATNVVDHPVLTVITSISLDHEYFLGDTLTDIAFEKAGILKRGAAAVIGPQVLEVSRVLDRELSKRNLRAEIEGEDWHAHRENGRLVIHHSHGLFDLPLSNLAGEHQVMNASTAVMALLALQDPAVTENVLTEGLTRVAWPGRLQKLERGRLVECVGPGSEVWLDGGHNEAAGQAIASAMASLEEKNPLPLYLVFGMLDTKDPAAFITSFEGLASGALTVSLQETRQAISAGKLQEIIESSGQLSAMACDHLAMAMDDVADIARKRGPIRLIITGSLYLVGEALRFNADLEAMPH